MVDDDPKPVGVAPDDQLVVLYDWFKYLTSLSLFTLGGVLSISQAAEPGQIKPAMFVVVLVFVSISGVLAFSGAGVIVGNRTNNQPLPDYTHKLSSISAMSLMVGVGAFIYVMVKAL